MARDHARLLLSIWSDPDWVTLTAAQQHAYLALVSSEDLSYCGVAPLIPARYQHISSDMTPRRFMAAVDGLEARSFVVTDRDTVEVLVRSYVRHDGLIKQPNVTKAMVTALRRVHSQRIAEAVWAEIARLYADDPGAKGWKGFAEAFPEGWGNLTANPSPKGSAKGSRKGKATPFPLSPTPFPMSVQQASNVTNVQRETRHDLTLGGETDA